MFLRVITVVRKPDDGPEHSGGSENKEHHSPPRHRDQGHDEERRNGCAQARSGVLKALAEGAAVRRKPAYEGSGARRKGTGLAHAEEKTRKGQRRCTGGKTRTCCKDC